MIIGFNALLAILFHPIIIPINNPAIEPAEKPIRTRIKLLKKLCPNTPLAVKYQNSVTTAEKGGKKK